MGQRNIQPSAPGAMLLNTVFALCFFVCLFSLYGILFTQCIIIERISGG
jgi:hypothetical protein